VVSARTPVDNNITRRSEFRILRIQLTKNNEHSVELENESMMF